LPKRTLRQRLLGIEREKVKTTRRLGNPETDYDPARARANRDARACSAVYAINVERRSDVADRTDKIGR
jgi:hypothetical protein